MVAIPERARVSAAVAGWPADSGTPLVIAACASVAGAGGVRTPVEGHYNGKIDAPKLYTRALVGERARRAFERRRCARPRPARALGLLRRHRAAWRPGRPRRRRRPAAATRGLREPAGARHDGLELGLQRGVLRHAPELYGAIHFHDDDLDDCRWETDIVLDGARRPAERRLRAPPRRSGDAEDHVPFFVLPPRGTADGGDRSSSSRPPATSPTRTTTSSTTCPVAQSILGPHARASPSRTSISTAISTSASRPTTCTPTASGVCFSSSRRPIMNMRPKYRHATGSVWQFPADLHLVDWLERRGLLLRRRHRPRAAPRGRRRCSRATASCSRARTRSTTASACSTPGRSTSATAVAGCTSAPTASTGSRLAPGEAVDDRGAQVRVGLARLAGQAGRVLPRDHGRARRPLALARPGAAEAVRHGLHVRGLRPQRRIPPDARRARPAGGVHPRGHRDPTR